MPREVRPDFLSGHELRPLSLEGAESLRPVCLILGKGASPLEVVVTASARQPGRAALQRAWKRRHGGRAAPVLPVALHGDRAAICGPAGDEPPAYVDLGRGLVERLCATALAEPDRHAALRFLRGALPEIESPLPGLRNEGLLATHELEYGVPRRTDWQNAGAAAARAQTARGEELVRALGFEIEPLHGPASMLVARGTRTAVAVLLTRGESADVASDRFSSLSPVSYALHQADQQRVPYVIVTEGPTLRLYPVETDVGVGRRGRTETFVEVHLDLLPDVRVSRP